MVRAIVIDDDPDTVEIFSEYLSMKGVQIVGTGYNGKEAVNLYQKHCPDVVFLDCMMPQYDGFYALGNIQQINPEAKVIMVTGDLTKKTKLLFEKMKVSGVIFKPYDIDDVIQVLNNVIAGKLILPPIR